MALIDIYNDNKIFRKFKFSVNVPNFPKTVPTPNSNTGLLSNEDEIKGVLKNYYESFPVLNVNMSGQSPQPLVTIKVNSSAADYKTKFDYTITRAGAIGKWLKTPNGLKFLAEQTVLQTFNPQLETKIYKPNSILSNLIPFTGYHERRHQTLSSLFGLPINLVGGLAPATYTEAIWYSDKKSRNIYQSPFASLDSDRTYVGIEYANAGRDIMTSAKTWKGINPNRYAFPIGVDGGGLPNSSRITPAEEMNQNIILSAQGARFTKSSGFNPTLDAQITINKQKSGTSFLQSLLRNIPFVNTVMAIFGYGILGAAFPKVKIYNPYNPTFSYSRRGGKEIRVVDGDGELLDTYDLRQDNKSPIERLLYAIITGTTKANEKPATGITFKNKASIEPDFEKIQQASRVDNRILRNPQDGTTNINQYLQTYGDIVTKQDKNQAGSANINDSLNELKPYSNYMKEDVGARIINLRTGHGFAWSGAKLNEDREGDLINQLNYGEDSENKDFQDLIPFKFYHINEQKWIIFRASLTSLTDNISPEWNSKSYIGRADKLYTYKGADRKINFSFKVMIHSPQELRPVYEKINYLIGLSYPKYRSLNPPIGNYMEAPFVKLTIGDLFTDVYGILDGSITITYPEDATWEIRDIEKQLVGKNQQADISKVPRLIEISIGSFTPFSLDNNMVSSTSPFYSMIKKWQTNNNGGNA